MKGDSGRLRKVDTGSGSGVLSLSFLQAKKKPGERKSIIAMRTFNLGLSIGGDLWLAYDWYHGQEFKVSN